MLRSRSPTPAKFHVPRAAGIRARFRTRSAIWIFLTDVPRRSLPTCSFAYCLLGRPASRVSPFEAEFFRKNTVSEMPRDNVSLSDKSKADFCPMRTVTHHTRTKIAALNSISFRYFRARVVWRLQPPREPSHGRGAQQIL